jgi:SAM-dependent methyltransferase
MAPYHRRVAHRLQTALRGQVLCIGGLWAQIDLDACHCELTVGDVSEQMLKFWASERVRTCVCDARSLPFGEHSFDHLVFPLVLHHIAGVNGQQARRFVRGALAEARRVLRPGGGLWISEFCVSALLYWAELLASPLSHAALALAHIPLVVMHSSGFYRRVLRRLGFTQVEVSRVVAGDAGPLDPVRPVIGLPWLVVPRFAYPISPTLVTARA